MCRDHPGPKKWYSIEYCIANRSNKWCWHNLAGFLGWLLHSQKFVDFLQLPSWTPLVHWTSFGSATSPTPVKRNSQRMRLRPRHPITQIELAPSLPRLSNVAQKLDSRVWFHGGVLHKQAPVKSHSTTHMWKVHSDLISQVFQFFLTLRAQPGINTWSRIGHPHEVVCFPLQSLRHHKQWILAQKAIWHLLPHQSKHI